MLKFIAAIGTFLGTILKAVLPTLLKEAKKPRSSQPAGYSKELKDDMDKQLRDQLTNSTPKIEIDPSPDLYPGEGKSNGRDK